MSLFFAGTGGSVPSARRGLPAILLRRGGERLLFDCGEGTQRQLLRSVGLADVECVFITHFHADHWLGLPGMLKSFALRDREQPLTVHGPPGLHQLMAETRFIYGRRLPYELGIEELAPGEALERDGYRIAAVPVDHGGRAAIGYAIVEDARPGELDPALAERLGVKPGPDFGRLVRGETVAGVAPEQVVGPTREGRKVVISGDTRPCEALAIAAYQADVLVHEATFTEEEAARARHTGHSTARQAAALARDTQARMLILTHLSTRYAGRELREEARAVFPTTEIARDFDTVEIPFPERAPAQLVRWSSRATLVGGGGAEAATENGGQEDSEGKAPQDANLVASSIMQ
ncbi:MAG TPA: ribonuclease Z [Solirubrobacteraceae bacterium]|nr:ribonuclease Z [Solirubrobacteraceae bacterium]